MNDNINLSLITSVISYKMNFKLPLYATASISAYIFFATQQSAVRKFAYNSNYR